MDGKRSEEFTGVEAVHVDTPAANTKKIEGITSFPSRKDTTFRFVLSVADDKLNIWLEDRKAKLRWESGFLGISDFVTNDNIIARATVEDYTRYFKTALEEALDGVAANEQRRLVDGEYDWLQLRIVAKLVVLDSIWTLPYEFALVPMATAQVDLVESRLFDVEEKLGRLNVLERSLAKVNEKLELGSTAEVRRLETRILELESKLKTLVPSMTEFDSATNISHGQRVVWKPVTSGTFAVDNDGTIYVHSTGAYLVMVQAEFPANCYGAISLHLNDKEVLQTNTPADDTASVMRNTTFCSASWGMRLNKDDKLSLFFYCSSDYMARTAGSKKMVIIKLSG